MLAGFVGMHIAPSFKNMPAVQTDNLVDLPVNVINIFIAGFFMQGIDILRYYIDLRRIVLLQLGNCQMSSVWFGFIKLGTQLVIKIMHIFWIAFKCFNSGDIFHPMFVP